jgi:hydroxyacylglutathione hydrolase
MNPILQLTREEFIEYKVNEHHEYWPYFRAMEKYNVEGAPFVCTVRASHKALSLAEFRDKIDEGAVVVDTRSPSAFGGAHIPSSYSVPLNLLSFVSWFISPEKMILAVVDDTRDLEAVSKLTRIGYDNVLGYLAGGLSSWYSLGYSTESLKLIQAKELRSWLESGKECFLLDVRSRDEFEEGHIESAKNVYLGHLQERIDEIPHGLPTAVICGSGNRASIGASVLLRNKYHDVYNFLGGMSAWKKLEYPTSIDVPST